jgi:hypothetical protein
MPYDLTFGKEATYKPQYDLASEYQSTVKKQMMDEAKKSGGSADNSEKAMAAVKAYQTLTDKEATGADKLSSGLMASSTMGGPAAPFLLGGGLALGALEQGRKQRQAQEDAKVKAYTDYVARQQSSLNNLANFTQNMGIL